MHVYQMRSSVPSVVSASQERINVCMGALKDVSKVWVVAKMVHTLFESILGNKVLEERLQKAAGKRVQKPSKSNTNNPNSPQMSRAQNPTKRKYDEIDLSFPTGPPAPQVSYERSRPQTPSVTPSHDLGGQQQQQHHSNLLPISSPQIRNNTTEQFLPLVPSRGPSRSGTRPTSPFNTGYSIPATPPDLFLVTRNSPPISQSLWENFQPEQLFPDSTSAAMAFSSPGANPVDPALQIPAQQMQQSMQHQHQQHGMSQNLGVPQINMGMSTSQNWPGMDGGLGRMEGQGHNQNEDSWSNSSVGGAPIVPTTLNVEDWFQFFGINGDIGSLNMDGR